MVNLKYGADKHPGLLRQKNEDEYLLTEVTIMGGCKAILMAAIDGVGGLPGGSEAAIQAKKEFKNSFNIFLSLPPEIEIEQAMVIANNHIVDSAMRNNDLSTMRCVASACVYDPFSGMLHYSHVGDSRIYIYHNGFLKRITHDHSIVGALLDSGEISSDEAMTYPRRNEIDRLLGESFHMLGDGYVEHGSLYVEPNSQILVCTDGLHDQVSEETIKHILDLHIDPSEKVTKLINAANSEGGRDNVTAVLCEIQ